MTCIDTHIIIGPIAANFGARSKSEPQPGKLPAKDVIAKSGPDTAEFNAVTTDVSFSTYGPHGERTAIVVKNSETGEVIRAIPSEEIQKLYVKMQEMLVKDSG
jgi:uncharacterized FlaG/YvyC family protein